MGDTSIQWTDATWNPVTGCSKVSPGCAHCYAERVAIRLWPSQYPPIHLVGMYVDDAGPSSRPRVFTDVQCHEDRLDQPLRWKRPRKIFVNSMSDLFHEDVPDAFIDRVFAVMALARQHTFQILTKRPLRMMRYLNPAMLPSVRVADAAKTLYTTVTPFALPSEDVFDAKRVATGAQWIIPTDRAWPLKNVWLGVSVENQRFADERIPLLLQTPAAVRFISAEPLLGPVDLEQIHNSQNLAEGQRFIHALKGYAWDADSSGYYDVCSIRGQLDWVIVGGESGKGARPFDVAWARAIVQQCKGAGVPVFMKQIGARPLDDGKRPLLHSSGGSWHFKDRPIDSHGGDLNEWPDEIRVRQFPEARA